MCLVTSSCQAPMLTRMGAKKGVLHTEGPCCYFFWQESLQSASCSTTPEPRWGPDLQKALESATEAGSKRGVEAEPLLTTSLVALWMPPSSPGPPARQSVCFLDCPKRRSGRTSASIRTLQRFASLSNIGCIRRASGHILLDRRHANNPLS